MKLSEIAKIIEDNLDALPWEFTTRDTFCLFNDGVQWAIRGQANIALRKLERANKVFAVRFGKNNVLVWRKTQPRPTPEWI